MTEKPESRAFQGHYAASQFRVETWNQLKHQTEKLHRLSKAGRAVGELETSVEAALELLTGIEQYWAFPGVKACAELQRLFQRGWYQALQRQAARTVRLLVSGAYRHRDHAKSADELDAGDVESLPLDDHDKSGESRLWSEERPYFEVLVVDEIDAAEETALRAELLAMRAEDDDFVYDIVVVPSFEDAVIAVAFNHSIQSCVLRYQFPIESTTSIKELRYYLGMLSPDKLELAEDDPSGVLAEALVALRPELDLFKVTDETFGSVSASDSRCFRRVFYRQEDYLELHLSILKGIHERYETPFFDALREYSHKPTGVFHALPISRGKSITKSHWIQDMGRFYGKNIFLAETSSTTGGLDSLLQPKGPIKEAQKKVARAFGARQSFFVTNGTSTANKIVTQGLVRPGDLVLLSHDCHKSHPYALVLAGAQPVYLNAYPLNEFTMFGGVPLAEMKRQLFRLKQAGKLDRVRMLLLTNCTFDGITYDPERIMREVLAIKPDMVFLWDEAWFAFACATPTYRRRTSMAAARKLRAEFATPEYRERYAAWAAETAKLDSGDEATWVDRELLPDPDRARMRVYATHSTHKTLTSLRQGSMIHVYDQDFEQHAHDAFHEAYMTHTSTSPNYQILASLDVGRRQLELEGYELVRHSVGLAMMIRRQIVDHPLLAKYFKVLRVRDMIPEQYRPSGLQRFYDPDTGFHRVEEHWRQDEFALDPLRITLNIGATGMDGDTFRKLLIERFDIQINKTTRNTVLFLVNIGSTSGSATYLLDVLLRVALELEESAEDQSDIDRAQAASRVTDLTEKLPPLPHFSRFHAAFVDDPTGDTPEGDMRRAFFLAYDGDCCEHLLMDGSVQAAMKSGREVVSACFVTPYPPGFPILVPGQVITADILAYLKALDVKEIHGYDSSHGLRVFTQDALDRLLSESSRLAPRARTHKTAIQ
ncbi:MAG: aminotransferase class I/II-fold pyridoxal phosphate-dependent enzyme [Planctomycetes bacterium]|nr:aminotransferase class I/II-fold pyridoxal phosphate-dependent enzyme [Planctomycetota bacterium]